MRISAGAGPPATPPWVRAGFAVAASALALQAVVAVPAVRGRLPQAESCDSWLQVGVDALVAVLVLARARTVRRERWAWRLLGCGVLAFAAGDGYWTLVVRPADPPPAVSFADVLWLALYPFFYLGLSVLLRARVPRLAVATWFDGFIAATSAAAFASLPLLAALAAEPAESTWQLVAGLAYPAADIVLAGCLFGAWALTGWRTERVWLLLAGMAAFTLGDVASVLLETIGVDAGPALDLTWSVGLLAMAAAAWQPGPVRRGRPARLWVAGALPVGLAGACLALLLYGTWRPGGLPPASGILAATAVAAAVVRMLLTVRAVEALADARRQARTDDLTGLPNRRLFLERIDAALVDREPGAPLAVAILDLDRFKDVNDSFGHHVGDQLLQLVATRLHRPIEPAHTLVRMGGDEFGLLMPTAGAEDARAMAVALLSALREPFQLDGTALHVDASVGVAVFPGDGPDRATLLRHADSAMYAAKAAHTGFFLSATSPDDRATRRRLDTLEELRAGLVRGELALHYQPQVDIASGVVLGVEALLRWDHPTRGLVYPDAFLPIAEQAGLMGQITAEVLELALRQCATWRAAGIDITVAVNLSVSNLHDLDFPARVADALSRHGVPAAALHLEVTEGMLMTDADRAREMLTGLAKLGIRLAVDDYGTGYSSLSYLHTLPVGDLKLDRSFVAHCDTDPRSAAIVVSTVQLAHSLGLRMIAEGVENAAVLALLRRHGCDLGQGYHLGRPQNPAALTAWLRRADLPRPAPAGSHRR